MGSNNSKLEVLEKRVNLMLEAQLKHNAEYESLKEKYAQLHAEHEALLSKRTERKKKTIRSKNINNIAVTKLVEEILADPDANLYYLPDVAEKEIYTNVLKMLLNLLQKSFEHLDLNFIGHEIKISMTPHYDSLKNMGE